MVSAPPGFFLFWVRFWVKGIPLKICAGYKLKED